jgi:hypothetical protein
MIIDLAKSEDMPEILDIYARARKFMAEHGNPNQWPESYPPEKDLREDIDRGCLYICQGEKIEGVFKFITTPDPTYGKIIGAWLQDGSYGTLHRVASAGNIPHIFDAVVSWASGRCPVLRADTHRDNTVMQAALDRNGFKYCGIIFLDDGDERLAYERI